MPQQTAKTKKQQQAKPKQNPEIEQIKRRRREEREEKRVWKTKMKVFDLKVFDSLKGLLYNLMVEEIKSVYTQLQKDLTDLYPSEFPLNVPSRLYVKFKDLKQKMPAFLEFSKLTQYYAIDDEEIKKIIRLCMSNVTHGSEMDDNPILFFTYVVNSVLVGKPTSDLRPVEKLLGFKAKDIYTIRSKGLIKDIDMSKIPGYSKKRYKLYLNLKKIVQKDNASKRRERK